MSVFEQCFSSSEIMISLTLKQSRLNVSKLNSCKIKKQKRIKSKNKTKLETQP